MPLPHVDVNPPLQLQNPLLVQLYGGLLLFYKKENIYSVVMRMLSWVAAGEGGNPAGSGMSQMSRHSKKKIEELLKRMKFQVVEWISN